MADQPGDDSIIFGKNLREWFIRLPAVFYLVSLFICLENKRFNHRPAPRLSEITTWRTIYIDIYNSNLHEWREMKPENRDERWNLGMIGKFGC